MRARIRTIGLIGTAVVAAVIVAGCSAGASKDSASSSGSAPQAAPAERQADAGGVPDQAGGTAKDVPAQSPDLSVDQRSIIYTGSITIRVDDVNQAAAKVTGIVAGSGGFVGGDKRDSSGDSSTAEMTLRVPADKFQTVVNALAKDLGKEESRGISTEDVTEQTIDLDARIAVQQARVDSGRNLLAKAKSLSDLVMLEKEVATRESDLASLQAKKRHLADLTALSTITVVLLDPGAPAVPVKTGPPGFLAGLSGGWHALLASLGVLLTILGALLPWVIALGIPVAAILWAYRRWWRRPRGLVLRPANALPGAPPVEPEDKDR
jgi:outer membrane murein-binding lipoprotein Lpp